MDSKIFEFFRRRPQSGDRKSLGKTCRVIWGRCRARAEALRGLGFRKHLFAEKVRKTKASIKQKCMIMTFIFERSVWSRKSIENCNVWWFSLWCDVPERGSLFRSPSLFAQFCNSLTASKTAHVWSKTVFLQECLVLPHQTTKFRGGGSTFVVIHITFREGCSPQRARTLK